MMRPIQVIKCYIISYIILTTGYSYLVTAQFASSEIMSREIDKNQLKTMDLRSIAANDSDNKILEIKKRSRKKQRTLRTKSRSKSRNQRPKVSKFKQRHCQRCVQSNTRICKSSRENPMYKEYLRNYGDLPIFMPKVSCECKRGYYGNDCQHDFCDTCNREGTARDELSSDFICDRTKKTCTCKKYFYGHNCNYIENNCYRCDKQGTELVKNSKYQDDFICGAQSLLQTKQKFSNIISPVEAIQCSCKPTYSGEFCQIEHCTTCDKDGTLKCGKDTNFRCKCKEKLGFRGENCDKFDSCSLGFCYDPGTRVCLETSKAQEKAKSLGIRRVEVTCVCDNGYTGEDCGVKVGQLTSQETPIKIKDSSSSITNCQTFKKSIYSSQLKFCRLARSCYRKKRLTRKGCKFNCAEIRRTRRVRGVCRTSSGRRSSHFRRVEIKKLI